MAGVQARVSQRDDGPKPRARSSSLKLVSRDSALCSNNQGVPTPQGRCNLNQFSQPFTGPDGALYVVWDNYNLTAARPGEGDGGEGDFGANAARLRALLDDVDDAASVDKTEKPVRPAKAAPPAKPAQGAKR